ncbi:hypothetical protein N0V90_003721 [Kalmusia sp. IMI 367209]|nr:hypothetical protein N0V90_003721 [Kalmusia sp. IMI 367209]
MTIFQLNKRRGHKFLFSGFIFGFCMARITTCTLRIASICLPSNISLALAAQIFVAAGIIIIFVINLVWAQRILRAHQPTIGWHAAIPIAFNTLYVLIVLTLAVVIIASVQSYFTLRPRTRTIDRALQLYGSTLFAVVAFLPIVIVGLATTLLRKETIEKFGHGRQKTKILVLLIGATLCCLGAAFRAGTSWKHPALLTQPQPAYLARGYFYFFNFGIEVLIIYMYAIMRMDLRFWVPDGAKGPGSYSSADGRVSEDMDEEHGDEEGKGDGKEEGLESVLD